MNTVSECVSQRESSIYTNIGHDSPRVSNTPHLNTSHLTDTSQHLSTTNGHLPPPVYPPPPPPTSEWGKGQPVAPHFMPLEDSRTEMFEIGSLSAPVTSSLSTGYYQPPDDDDVSIEGE